MRELSEIEDFLLYVESYLEYAVASEECSGLLMSAKPLLNDVRNFTASSITKGE